MSERRRMMTSAKENKTFALFHFDNSMMDECGNIVLSTVPGSYTDALIGSGKSINMNGGTSGYGNFSFGDTDFTLEFWIKPASNIGDWKWMVRIFDGSSSNIIFIACKSGKLYFTYPDNSNYFTNYRVGNTYHIAMVYDKTASTLTAYINGVSFKTWNSAAFQSGDSWQLGITNYNFILDELRLSKVKRYTSNFTIPISPFVLD